MYSCLILSSEEQLEFPVLYASAKEGWASSTYTKKPPEDARNMSDLLDAIIRHVPPPTATLDEPFRMLVSAETFSFHFYAGYFEFIYIIRASALL